MKKLLLLILIFISSIFLFAGDKDIPPKPFNLPEGAEWDTGPRGGWHFQYKNQNPYISWYSDGTLSFLHYDIDDKNYSIFEKYYENGNLEYIKQEFNQEYYEKVFKKNKISQYPQLEVGKQQLFYKNGKLKEERSYAPEVKKGKKVSPVLCGSEVFYDETGKETKRIEHNVKCEYGFSDIPRQPVDELIAIVRAHKDRERNASLIKNPVVGKIISIDQTSKVIEVAYKKGFELSIGDQICCLIDSEVVSFECQKNDKNTGFFVLKDDNNKKFASVNTASQLRFYKENEVKYTDYLKSGPRPKAGDIKIIAGIEFVYIPAGEFDEQGDKPDKVYRKVVKAFWMTKYEVTLGDYLKLCYEQNWDLPKNRSSLTFNSRYPVNLGKDHTGSGFCKWFGEKHGVETVLPRTEEWEYAARAGTTTEFYWGNGKIDDYAWYEKNSGGKLHPVGQKKPNAFGLYDMIGNADEWCDIFTLRGGSFRNTEGGLRYDATTVVSDYLAPGETREELYGWLDKTATGFRMIIRVP